VDEDEMPPNAQEAIELEQLLFKVVKDIKRVVEGGDDIPHENVDGENHVIRGVTLQVTKLAMHKCDSWVSIPLSILLN
jgi:hypothetical protein